MFCSNSLNMDQTTSMECSPALSPIHSAIIFRRSSNCCSAGNGRRALTDSNLFMVGTNICATNTLKVSFSSNDSTSAGCILTEPYPTTSYDQLTERPNAFPLLVIVMYISLHIKAPSGIDNRDSPLLLRHPLRSTMVVDL